MIPKGQYSHDLNLIKKLLRKIFCTEFMNVQK
jgi:hypothetical protein